MHAESGGICTFCGAQVALRYADGSAVEHIAAGAAAEGQGTHPSVASAGSSPDTGAASSSTNKAGGQQPEQQQQQQAKMQAPRQLSESEAAALELKDRLVEYDRNSARRTTVIDDQSDFFEIDSNAWLNDEVGRGRQVGKWRTNKMSQKKYQNLLVNTSASASVWRG